MKLHRALSANLSNNARASSYPLRAESDSQEPHVHFTRGDDVTPCRALTATHSQEGPRVHFTDRGFHRSASSASRRTPTKYATHTRSVLGTRSSQVCFAEDPDALYYNDRSLSTRRLLTATHLTPTSQSEDAVQARRVREKCRTPTI